MVVYLDPLAQPPPKFLPGKKEEGDDKEATPILNKEYAEWVVKDQQVLSYLLTSLSRDILSQVSMSKTTVVAWESHRRHVRVAIACMSDQHEDGAGDCFQGHIFN